MKKLAIFLLIVILIGAGFWIKYSQKPSLETLNSPNLLATAIAENSSEKILEYLRTADDKDKTYASQLKLAFDGLHQCSFWDSKCLRKSLVDGFLVFNVWSAARRSQPEVQALIGSSLYNLGRLAHAYNVNDTNILKFGKDFSKSVYISYPLRAEILKNYAYVLSLEKEKDEYHDKVFSECESLEETKEYCKKLKTKTAI